MSYARTDAIDVAVHFEEPVEVDAMGGIPTVTLAIGTARKAAEYESGSGTDTLRFRYRVVGADADDDGVDIVANSLALNNGSITAVSDATAANLAHAGVAGGQHRRVDGSLTPTSAGICRRSAAVQAAILARLADRDDCAQVTGTDLAGITGRVDVSAQVAARGRMSALRTGDFAGLSGVTALDLDYHAIRSIPSGVFDPLTSLTELSMAYNQTQTASSMRTLPAGLLDSLTTLTTLNLAYNDLETLPDGIFEPLRALVTLKLEGNPGSASFVPHAVAGPDGGFDAQGGDTVTLGAERAPDPWGGNVTLIWRQTGGSSATQVALSATDVARPTITIPGVAVAEDLVYELTAIGAGAATRGTANRHRTVRTVTVRVAAAPSITSIEITSAAATNDTYPWLAPIRVATHWTQPVTVTGTPQLALTIGTDTRQASYESGSPTPWPPGTSTPTASRWPPTRWRRPAGQAS